MEGERQGEARREEGNRDSSHPLDVLLDLFHRVSQALIVTDESKHRYTGGGRRGQQYRMRACKLRCTV